MSNWTKIVILYYIVYRFVCIKKKCFTGICEFTIYKYAVVSGLHTGMSSKRLNIHYRHHRAFLLIISPSLLYLLTHSMFTRKGAPERGCKLRLTKLGNRQRHKMWFTY